MHAVQRCEEVNHRPGLDGVKRVRGRTPREPPSPP
jgi:hypothetical protein